MATSLIYRNARIYELLMRALYGRHYADRYRVLTDLIPSGASVLDVCCGPGVLFTRYLRHRNVRYHGLDINPSFIAGLRNQGGTGEVWDARSAAELPAADFVIMQASLYHFLPDPAPIMDKMLAAADEQVLIAEPIRNLATSNNRLLAMVGRRFTNAGSGEQHHRFTADSLDSFFAGYLDQVIESKLIAGGREKLYVLNSRRVAAW